MGYMNYDLIKNYSDYTSALARIGFVIDNVTSTLSRAYWRGLDNDDVYLSISKTNNDYGDTLYIHMVIDGATVGSTIWDLTSMNYYTQDIQGSTMYLSTAYWHTPGHGDELELSIQTPNGAGNSTGMFINNTFFEWYSSGMYMANRVKISESFIENLPSSSSFMIVYENMTVSGTVRKSDYKFSTYLKYNVAHDYSSGMYFTTTQTYNCHYLPYIYTDGGGVVFPSPTAIATYFSDDGGYLQFSGGSNSIFFLPPTEKSTRWLVSCNINEHPVLYSCNSETCVDISYINVDPDPYYLSQVTMENFVGVTPLIDKTDNCGCITNLSYVTMRGIGSLSTNYDSWGGIIEDNGDKYYIFKRTSVRDESRKVDVYYYVVKISQQEEEE